VLITIEIKATEYILEHSPYAVLEYLNNIVTLRSNKQLISVAERKLQQLLSSSRSEGIAVAAVLHSVVAGARRADVGSVTIACSRFIVLVRRA